MEDETVKLPFALLVIAVATALPLAAATFDNAKFAQATGVRLDGGAKVNINEGQTLTAKVVNVAALAKIGLKGARNGEAVEVTSQGKKGFSFLHVPSGRRVEYIPPAEPADYFNDNPGKKKP